MQVALYARVSTPNQQQEGTILSQIQALELHITQQGWSLLPEHKFVDEGISASSLDRPALNRLREAAQRGEFEAALVLAPDRLARNYAHQWLLIEEFKELQLRWIFLQNPFGDSPQGKLLTQMQGMIAEYERVQILERTRRGRLEKARRGQLLSWAYSCYGYRYLPKRPDSPPQALIEPAEAEVIRRMYRLLVEEQLSCRLITRHLNQAHVPPPCPNHPVWHPSTVRNILTNHTYMGRARFNYRRSGCPQEPGSKLHPESEWVWTQAPAIISAELFAQAQEQLRRNAELARRMYKPSGRRYLLRRLVKCGQCGLGMLALHRALNAKVYHYDYYACKGRAPLVCGRPSACVARLVRADQLDELVWQALCQLLGDPKNLPQLHQSWSTAKQQSLAGLSTQQAQLRQRQERLERQDQRLLDAYQAEVINLEELQSRRKGMAAERAQLQQEAKGLAQAQQQTHHWQEIIDHAEQFRQLVGSHLPLLSFEERQAVVQCLIEKVVITGKRVDIYYALPFASAPQVCQSQIPPPEGPVASFCRLRLKHRRTRQKPNSGPGAAAAARPKSGPNPRKTACFPPLVDFNLYPMRTVCPVCLWPLSLAY